MIAGPPQHPSAAPRPQEKPRPRLARPRGPVLLLALLVAAHLGLGLDCARRWTVTHDEYWHLPAGVGVWRLGRFDLDDLNPPLTRLWSAMPVVAGGAAVDPLQPANEAFDLGDEFLQSAGGNFRRWLLMGRAMNLLLSAATAVLLYAWGKRLYGEPAGILAAALWSACPVALSNAALVTPDAGTALLFASTLFVTCVHAQDLAWRSALWLGVLLGLAQLAKFTNVVLYGLVPCVWLLARGFGLPRRANAARHALHGVVVVLLSVVVLNAGYLFRGTLRPLGDYAFRSRAMRGIAELAGGVPLPLPADYLRGFDRQRATMEGSHPVYLDGELRLEGFPQYYLFAGAYKLPHATQALFLLALVRQLGTRLGRRGWRRACVLLLPAGALVVIASSMGMQLGIRYILPALALLYVYAGQWAQRVDGWPLRAKRVVIALCLVLLPWGLRHHPHHLAYFNELSGGPGQGPRHLIDSNIDWGQDLELLKEYLDGNQVRFVRLAYFGMAPPAEFGFNYALPPSWAELGGLARPPPGWYAVSVNFLQGRPHTIRLPDNAIRGVDRNEFGYFRRLRPVACVGWSIYVYLVEPSARI